MDIKYLREIATILTNCCSIGVYGKQNVFPLDVERLAKAFLTLTTGIIEIEENRGK